MARKYELEVGGLTLEGVAMGGIETCLWCRELKLMFDIGRCPQGAIKYGTLLVSHGHSDHLSGLAYYISQRAMMGLKPPHVHLPEEIVDPVERILAAVAELEGFDLQYTLHPNAPGDVFDVGRGLRVTALKTTHRAPSRGYVVQRVSRKLLDEFSGRPGGELAALRREGAVIDREVETPVLCVTGDTQIEFFQDHPLVRRCPVLVHEITSWDDRRDVDQTRRWGHTHVDEILDHFDDFEGKALVLVHRSMRHSRKQALEVVERRFPKNAQDRVHVFGW